VDALTIGVNWAFVPATTSHHPTSAENSSRLAFRNRDRIVEIISFTKRTQEELSDILSGREEEEDGG
jgi:hypothetical protein